MTPGTPAQADIDRVFAAAQAIRFPSVQGKKRKRWGAAAFESRSPEVIAELHGLLRLNEDDPMSRFDTPSPATTFSLLGPKGVVASLGIVDGCQLRWPAVWGDDPTLMGDPEVLLVWLRSRGIC